MVHTTDERRINRLTALQLCAVLWFSSNACRSFVRPAPAPYNLQVVVNIIIICINIIYCYYYSLYNTHTTHSQHTTKTTRDWRQRMDWATIPVRDFLLLLFIIVVANVLFVACAHSHVPLARYYRFIS